MTPVRIHRKAFAVAFIVTLACGAVAWAITTDQIWQRVYDSANTALRASVVAGS